MHDLIILGGGAAGIFAALAAKEQAPNLDIVVLEKHNTWLAKVRISGGGRCNVTHACFEPRLLVQNYPRGHKELLSPFHTFQPKETFAWFEARGVTLKTEKDGRCFPTTDSSSTIIDCLLNEAARLGIQLRLQERVEEIHKKGDFFLLRFKEGKILETKRLMLATGSSKEGYRWAEGLGHTIHEPVPSLFTFNIPNFALSALSGIALEYVEIRLLKTKLLQKGPLLITHFGLSGPAVLKLSAWGARLLHEQNYTAQVGINWLGGENQEAIYQSLLIAKEHSAQKTLSNCNLFHLPKSLWRALTEELADIKLQTVSDTRLRKLAQKLHCDIFTIGGKTTHKEEFVTCGGVNLVEIDFKTMQSKKCPGLFFAGEILDIDGITGGFNFQNAWTTGYLAGKHACLQ